jgi:hypothetical protein
MAYDKHAADVERENALLRSILARLFEVGPTDQPWGELWDDGTLWIDSHEYDESVRFTLTDEQATVLRSIRDGA